MTKTTWIRTLVAVGVFAAAAPSLQAFETKPFDEAKFKAAQAAGGPVIVHVTAPWCPTCTAQHKALDSIGGKAEFAKVPVFNVDFDNQKDALKMFKATTQSTVIAFKGAQETGRVAGVSAPDALETLAKSAAP